MSDKIDLKPCPFCGAKAEMGLNFGRFGTGCTECSANMRSSEVCGDFENESLIESWNTRYVPTLNDKADMRKLLVLLVIILMAGCGKLFPEYESRFGVGDRVKSSLGATGVVTGLSTSKYNEIVEVRFDGESFVRSIPEYQLEPHGVVVAK